MRIGEFLGWGNYGYPVIDEITTNSRQDNFPISLLSSLINPQEGRQDSEDGKVFNSFDFQSNELFGQSSTSKVNSVIQSELVEIVHLPGVSSPEKKRKHCCSDVVGGSLQVQHSTESCSSKRKRGENEGRDDLLRKGFLRKRKSFSLDQPAAKFQRQFEEIQHPQTNSKILEQEPWSPAFLLCDTVRVTRGSTFQNFRCKGIVTQVRVATPIVDTLRIKGQGGGTLTEAFFRTGIGWNKTQSSHHLKTLVVVDSNHFHSKPLHAETQLPSSHTLLSKKKNNNSLMEELVLVCNALSLHPAETRINPPALKSLNHETNVKVTIVGNLFHPKITSLSALFRALAKVWYLQGKLSISSTGEKVRKATQTQFPQTTKELTKNCDKISFSQTNKRIRGDFGEEDRLLDQQKTSQTLDELFKELNAKRPKVQEPHITNAMKEDRGKVHPLHLSSSSKQSSATSSSSYAPNHEQAGTAIGQPRQSR